MDGTPVVCEVRGYLLFQALFTPLLTRRAFLGVVYVVGFSWPRCQHYVFMRLCVYAVPKSCICPSPG